MGLPPQKNIRLPVKNMGLPLKNMGLPLKNFIASQLGRGGEVADIICITPFGTVLYPQDHCLPRGRFWVVKQRPSRLFVVGRNVA